MLFGPLRRISPHRSEPVLSVLGTNNNTVLAGPRYLYALAETGRLPRVLAKIHPRYRTPYVADPDADGDRARAHRDRRPPPQREAGDPRRCRGARRAVDDRSPGHVHRDLRRRARPAAQAPLDAAHDPASRRPVIPIAALIICLLFLSAAEKKNFIGGAIALAVGALVYVSRGKAAVRARTRPADRGGPALGYAARKQDRFGKIEGAWTCWKATGLAVSSWRLRLGRGRGQSPAVTALKAARLFDGRAGGDRFPNAVIVVEDGKIVAVGAGLAIPAGATVIDLGRCDAACPASSTATPI